MLITTARKRYVNSMIILCFNYGHFYLNENQVTKNMADEHSPCYIPWLLEHIFWWICGAELIRLFEHFQLAWGVCSCICPWQNQRCRASQNAWLCVAANCAHRLIKYRHWNVGCSRVKAGVLHPMKTRLVERGGGRERERGRESETVREGEAGRGRKREIQI